MLDFVLVGITLIVIVLCLAAIGAAVRRALGNRTRTLDDGFLAFWLGFAAVTWFLTLWNFAFPIDSAALVVVAIASGTCLAASGWILGPDGRSHLTHPRIATILTLLVAAAWVTSQCLAPFRSWDGVLYHIQGVAWAKAYPAIPGIANLHGPLAFNNSSLLYDALVDSWLWEGRGFHLANGALLLAAVLQGASAGVRWWRHGNQARSVRLFEFLLLPIALYYTPEVATYSTDLPMALMLTVAIARSYAFLQEPQRHASMQTPAIIALLFAAAVVIKLTAAVFAAAALLVLAWRDLRHPDGASGRLSAWVWAAVATIVYLGPWIARGFILSGYPLFPLPYLGIDVDWRAPLEHARAEVANITFTEREFSWNFVGRSWIQLTFVRNVGAILLPSLLAALAFVWWWSMKKGLRRLGLAEWGLVLPSLVAIAAWLPTAPSHRYAPVLFWTLAAVSVCAWLQAGLPASKLGIKTARLAAVAIVLSPLLASSTTALLLDGPRAGVLSLKRNLVGSWDAGLASLPTNFPVQTFVTRSGVPLNTPQPRPNAPNMPNACGNAPLPCTANPAPNLELRDEGTLERGFRIRGDWQMTNFPYHWRPTFLSEWRARQTPDR